MAKFNKTGTRARVSGPISGGNTPAGRTHEGGPGYARDLKSELFLLAVTNMVGENTFYESPEKRDERYAQLVRRAAIADPKWTFEMLRWLRGPEANLRTAALVGAAEFVKAHLEAGPGSDQNAWNARRADHNTAGLARRVVDAVLQRPDEPGELIAYWTTMYGKRIPKPVKRGVADAIRRLYTEYSLLKYDTSSHEWRFADAIDLVHPRATPPPGYFDRRDDITSHDELMAAIEGFKKKKGDLYKFALDRRHNREIDMIDLGKLTHLDMICANHVLRFMAGHRGEVDRLLDPANLKAAGMTWEDVLSLAGSKINKRKLWESLIDADALGYMAALRNLRNIDEAGVDDAHADKLIAKLTDPAQVTRSRQLPMRFLSAYRAAPSLRWGYPLERALDHSLANVPELPGNTLILIDTSGSMHSPMSDRSQLMRWDAAVVFGLALARRAAHVDVVSFSGGWGGGVGTKVFPIKTGESLLKSVQRWDRDGFFIGGGTDTGGAIRAHLKTWHEQVVILTDEQSSTDVEHAVPRDTDMFTFNLAGYRYGHAAQNRAHRYTVGGLTDAGFKMIGLLSRDEDAPWPWETGNGNVS